MNNPCLDCELRHIGCHITCKDYLEWKLERDIRLAQAHKDKQLKNAKDCVQYFSTNRRRKR